MISDSRPFAAIRFFARWGKYHHGGAMRHAMLLFGAMSLAASRIEAQLPSSLPPGTRVRVSAATRQLMDVVGVVIAQRSDSLWIRGDVVGDTLTFDVRDLTRLDISGRKDRHTLAGAGIGLVCGALIGAATGAAAGDDASSPSSGIGLRPSAGFKAAVGAAALGIVGTVVGAFAGHASVADHWDPVLAQGPKVTTAGSARATTFNFGVRYRPF
jgi:hypothetical protein